MLIRSLPLFVTVSNIINDKGRQKVKVGTRGSLLTQNILEAITEAKRTDAQTIAEKFLKVFQNPVNYLTYLQSDAFADEIIKVCKEASKVTYVCWFRIASE